MKVVGKTSLEECKRDLQKEPQIIIGTPGRVLDMINKNADGLNKLAGFLKDMQDNQNLMAVKILKLEKILSRYQMTEGADEKRKN